MAASSRSATQQTGRRDRSRRGVDAGLCPAARHARRIHRPGRRRASALAPSARARSPALEQEAIEQRFEAADRRIRNMGMSYRVQGESAERSWPLSRMPLLIPEGRMARDRARRRAARRIARAHARRRLWRGRAGPGRAAARRGGDRLDRFPRLDARRRAARRALAAPLRRRYRPRAGRALVGARRPHAGAVRLRLCAGEPARRLAGLSEPL